MNKSPLHRFCWLLVALLSVCAYPVMYVYCLNIAEVALRDVLSPILVFFLIGFFAWMIFWILSGNISKGAFSSLIFMFVFMNYAKIDAGIRMIVPDWRWWRIAPAFLFVFINLALALRARGLQREEDAVFFKLTMAIGVFYLTLHGFHAAGGIYALSRIPRAQVRPETADPTFSAPSPAINPGDKQPNVYFFVFDEYARPDILKKYTGYDNTPFLRGLESRGFNVSYTSRASFPNTRVAFANLLYYSTIYRSVPSVPAAISRPPLLDSFRKAGYTIYAKLHQNYQIDIDLVDVALKTKTVLTAMSIEKTVEEASFIAYLLQDGNEARRADALNLFHQVAELIVAKTVEPKFIFVHFMLPHEPFIFDEHGGPVAYENMHNWADTGFYVGQLQFASEKIGELTHAIIKNDPDAVVLIQSDHGVRFFSGMSGGEKYACLNVLYLSGQHQNIEGLSAINTLRLVLNFALKKNLDMEKD